MYKYINMHDKCPWLFPLPLEVFHYPDHMSFVARIMSNTPKSNIKQSEKKEQVFLVILLFKSLGVFFSPNCTSWLPGAHTCGVASLKTTRKCNDGRCFNQHHRESVLQGLCHQDFVVILSKLC